MSRGLSLPARSRLIRRSLIGVIIVLLLVIAAAIGWYSYMKSPRATTGPTQLVIIESGTPPRGIGKQLESKGLIRSELAFYIYIRLHGIRDKLQAGTYRLSPTQSLESVVTTLVSGRQDSFSITFYPGATLYDHSNIAVDKRTDVYTMLIKAGYSDSEIKAAFADKYSSPLFTGKPAGTTLEGYVYGDTFVFDTGTSVHDILQRTFDTFWEKIAASGFENKVRTHGLSLYQAITLASIVQREVSDADDQRQVAQVFYLRLKQDMALGSDVTYIYAANQMGTAATPELDSPYNTRIHAGLPPGPIASPGMSALDAVANPAAGDYLYFVAGYDGKTYFSKTNEQHEQNVSDHCKTLCYTNS